MKSKYFKITPPCSRLHDSSMAAESLNAVVGDPIPGCRRRLAEFLVSRGGRCTRNQWIAETCLMKKSIADQLTAEMVRKTKTHCIANSISDRNDQARECKHDE